MQPFTRHISVAMLGLAALTLATTALAQTPSTNPVPTPGPACAVSTTRIGSLDVTQIFGPSADPATCMRIQVENPSPGDILPTGGYAMQGFAFDPQISPVAGTTRVQVFLDDPNGGGQIVGDTQAGLQSDRAASFGAPFANAGFRVVAQIPRSAQGQSHALFVSVSSTSTGRTASVAIPIAVGSPLGVGVGSPPPGAP